MLIIGCDYHPGFQQIAGVDTDTGEVSERRLAHPEQVEQFYRELQQRAGGHEIQRALALVRASVARVAV